MGVSRKKPRTNSTGSGAGSGAASATATKALLLRFEQWYGRHSVDAGHEHPPVGEAADLLGELFALTGGRLREPTVGVLEATLAAVEAEPALASRLPRVIEMLEHYLDFAVESGAWRGSDAQIDESSEFLEVAYEVSTGLLLFLIDALDDVPDVSAGEERAALRALTEPLRDAEAVLDRVRVLLDELDPESVPGALAIERVLGLLAVAASPGLLPGASTEEIVGMLDTAAGVEPEQAATADAGTAEVMAGVEKAGIVWQPGGAVRPVAPAGLRAALADAVISLADEYGLLDDEGASAHPVGTALRVTATTSTGWRSLLLAAESDLGELHLALQLAFDWANLGEHAFTVGAAAGSEVGSRSPEPVDDEDSVECGALLVEPGDEIGYAYAPEVAAESDHDPHEVVVRLDGVDEPTETRRALPRCTGASGDADAAEVDRMLSPLRLSAS